MATFPCSSIWRKKLHSILEWLNTFNLGSFYTLYLKVKKKTLYALSLTIHWLWNIKSDQCSLKDDCTVQSKCFLIVNFTTETNSSKLKIKENRDILPIISLLSMFQNTNFIILILQSNPFTTDTAKVIA